MGDKFGFSPSGENKSDQKWGKGWPSENRAGSSMRKGRVIGKPGEDAGKRVGGVRTFSDISVS